MRTPVSASLAALIALLFAGCFGGSGSYAVPDEVAFQAADGDSFLLKNLRGQIVVLDFWATWCGPCRRSMPNFQRLHDRYEDRDDVRFLAVNTGWNDGETLGRARAYMEREGYTFPMAYDRQGFARRAFSVSAIPSTVFIDKLGYVRATHVGVTSEQTLAAEIEKILADPALKPSDFGGGSEE